MAHFGFIRPLMLSKILEVRNLIEHHDQPPPKYERCLELLEFTWYFLRSTDNICRSIIENFSLETEIEASEYDILLETGKKYDWKLNIKSGIIHNSFLSMFNVGNWIEVRVGELETFDKFSKRFEKKDSVLDYYLRKNIKSNDFIIWDSEIKGSVEYVHKLIEMYLKLSSEKI